MAVVIDSDFKALIPPLRPEEYEQLASSLQREGCRDRLVTWHGLLLDGHHRYEICQRLGIPFKTVEIAGVQSREDAKDWVCENQLGRRNLTDAAFAYFLGWAFQAREKRQGLRTDLTLCHGDTKLDAAAELAEERDVSRRTVYRAAEFARNVDMIASVHPEARQRLLSDENGLSRDEVRQIAELPKADLQVAAQAIGQGTSGADALREITRKNHLARLEAAAVIEAKELAGSEAHGVIIRGDARHIPLKDGCVQLVCTSPPFWSLRRYGVGAENGEIGREPTPEAYVANLVEVFREVRRVLRRDGLAFLNLGDVFLNKQLQGMPWKVVFALQADGWLLRSAITLCKINPIPDPARDRPASATEMFFMLAKSPVYYYDAEAVRTVSEPASDAATDGHTMRNWQIVTGEPTPYAHFATFGQQWIEPYILCGSARRSCSQCGAPWQRILEAQKLKLSDSKRAGGNIDRNDAEDARFSTLRYTQGFQPSCRHKVRPIPSLIFDPFFGSGTTGIVGEKLGRRWVGMDLSSGLSGNSKAPHQPCALPARRAPRIGNRLSDEVSGCALVGRAGQTPREGETL